MEPYLVPVMGVVALASFVVSSKVDTTDEFFRGVSAEGRTPSLATLVLSQVTTWIFARSLMNAAILGYFYGIAGALAYAAYYLSFLTGWLFVDRIRFQHGHGNLQGFLKDRFGVPGVAGYNVVVAVRLLSEVFANLLVVGVVFGAAGTTGYTLSILVIALLTLGYSMLGGLRASLRTDVLQAALLIAVLAVLGAIVFSSDAFAVGPVLSSSADPAGPGWVLLAVALLQIWSYPAHDPVMMDRGFLADRTTTRRSFFHAAWIAGALILAFGLLGVHAGLMKGEGEQLTGTLARLLGEPVMVLFSLALILSAVSTLDSTFSSAAKLAVVDMGLLRPEANNGRLAMAAFLLGGLVFLFLGSKDLFAAVAVSGTASMFLAPVLVFTVLLDRRVATWAFVVAFAAALGGAALYMVEAGGHLNFMEPLFGASHKYTKLLIICVGVLATGFGAFALGTARTADPVELKSTK